MGGLILTISPVLIFILLIKHKLVDFLQPHEGFAVSVKCFSLKCFSKIITFHISIWLVDNSADIPSSESVSDIKVLCIDTLLILIKLKHLEIKRATKLVVQVYVDPRRLVLIPWQSNFDNGV